MYIVPLKKAKEFFLQEPISTNPLSHISVYCVETKLNALLQHCTRGGEEKMCHFDKLQLYCICVPGVLTWVVAFLDKQLISFWTENKVIFCFL